ncbi:hypothetical protein [Neobacillus drentensis]|uniref:hypothetical protein n=1 Tax=Neobacillus drentensis TaxID=220684 RepID=UPI003000D59F
MKKRRKRNFLTLEKAKEVIERIRNPKVKKIVSYYVERDCWLSLYGDDQFCNVYSPIVEHNIIGDIAIESENGSFKIQLTPNDWKGIRNDKNGLNIEEDDFVQNVIGRIEKMVS